MYGHLPKLSPSRSGTRAGSSRGQGQQQGGSFRVFTLPRIPQFLGRRSPLPVALVKARGVFEGRGPVVRRNFFLKGEVISILQYHWLFAFPALHMPAQLAARGLLRFARVCSGLGSRGASVRGGRAPRELRPRAGSGEPAARGAAAAAPGAVSILPTL